MDGFDSAEDAMKVCRVRPSGHALEVLRTLNAASLTRHWCEPLATYPWWRYRSRVTVFPDGEVGRRDVPQRRERLHGCRQTYDSLINVVAYGTGLTYSTGQGSSRRPS